MLDTHKTSQETVTIY